MIEFCSSLYGIRTIYICSLPASIADLKTIGWPTIIDSFKLVRSKFMTHALFVVDWPHNGTEVQCDGIPLILPTVAYVPIWTYFGINKIMKSSYTMRITVTYDGLTYVIGGNENFHPPDPLPITSSTQTETTNA